jgi:hypothetical protein
MLVLIFLGKRGIKTGVKSYSVVDMLGHFNVLLYTPSMIGAIDDIKSVWDICEGYIKIALFSVNGVHSDEASG